MTCSTLHLEPLSPNHLVAAVNLDRLCLGGLWHPAAYQKEIESPNSDLLILRRDDLPSVIGLGCLWRIVDEAHVILLAVHPDVQRQGFGTLLLYGLLTQAVHQQMTRATLEVRESNQGAIALYQQFGFQLAGRRPGYYPTTQEDALIFWRSGLQDRAFSVELSAWRIKISERLTQQGWQWSEALKA